MNNNRSEKSAICQLNICNRALLMLNSTLINNLNEDTKNASYCKLLYNMVKAELLTTYYWKCSIAKISLIGNYKLNNQQSYPYEFTLPQECLNVISVENSSGINSNDFSQVGSLLFAGFENINIIYVKNIDEEFLDNNLSHLLSIKLACELAYSLTMDASLSNYLNAMYKEKFLQYSNLDSKKGHNNFYNNQDEIPSWISSHS